MEKEKCQANADPTGICEKIYNAVAFRKSGRSHSSMATTITDQFGVQTTENAAKASVPVPIETVAQRRAGFPGEVHSPIEKKEKMVKPPAFAQNSSRMTISPAKIEPTGQSKTKEDTTKPQTTKPTTVTVHIEGRVDDVAPKLELVLRQPENLRPTIASGHGQLNKVASKKEAKPAVSPLTEEKLKQEKSASSNVMVIIKGHGQGINAPPRADPAKPSHVSEQEEQLKPNVHAAATAKTMSTKNDQPSLSGHNKGDQEGKKPEHGTVNDRFSGYIARVKNKMRNPSNVSEETLNATPFSRLATRRDSFNDKVATYINRARKNIRTPSNIRDA